MGQLKFQLPFEQKYSKRHPLPLVIHNNINVKGKKKNKTKQNKDEFTFLTSTYRCSSFLPWPIWLTDPVFCSSRCIFWSRRDRIASLSLVLLIVEFWTTKKWSDLAITIYQNLLREPGNWAAAYMGHYLIGVCFLKEIWLEFVQWKVFRIKLFHTRSPNQTNNSCSLI